MVPWCREQAPGPSSWRADLLLLALPPLQGRRCGPGGAAGWRQRAAHGVQRGGRQGQGRGGGRSLLCRHGQAGCWVWCEPVADVQVGCCWR